MSVTSFWDASRISDYFGAARPAGRKHRGTDFSHGRGVAIPSPVVGTVTAKLAPASWHGFGHQITITADDGKVWSFAHLNAASPLALQSRVSFAQDIGTEGSTGWTTGPCVHVEIRGGGTYVNPAPFIASMIMSGGVTGTPPATGPAATPAGLDYLKGWNWRGIQEMLKRLYAYTGSIDNDPGVGTWKAMQRFLKANYGYAGAIDGLPGPGTIGALARWLRTRWGYIGNDVPGPIMAAAFNRASVANAAAF